mgnify:CR=1 FL=1
MSPERNKDELVNYIAQLSPVAWQHINLNGIYSFLQNGINIDMESLICVMDEFK